MDTSQCNRFHIRSNFISQLLIEKLTASFFFFLKIYTKNPPFLEAAEHLGISQIQSVIQNFQTMAHTGS